MYYTRKRKKTKKKPFLKDYEKIIFYRNNYYLMFWKKSALKLGNFLIGTMKIRFMVTTAVVIFFNIFLLLQY